MKKSAPSFSKTKHTPPQPRRSVTAVRSKKERVVVGSRRRTKPVAPKRRKSLPERRFEAMTTPIGHTLPVAPSGTTVANPTYEEINFKNSRTVEAVPVAVAEVPVVPPTLSQAEVSRRLRIMWVGVSITMVAIIGAWGWTLRSSLSASSAQSLSSVPVNQAQDQFNQLYQEVTRSLRGLTPPEASNSVQVPSTTPAVTLTPEQVDRIRQQLETAVPQSSSSTSSVPALSHQPSSPQP